jgi:hypothetical protein
VKLGFFYLLEGEELIDQEYCHVQSFGH